MTLNAITARCNGIADVIVTPVTITDCFTKKQETTLAIWDTGATNSVVTKSIAKKLHLKSLSKVDVRGVHGIQEVNVYLVNIRLNNGNIEMKMQVTECDELSADGAHGALIGMDVISLGDFSITNNHNQTVMTFQIPSTHRHDYTEEINLRHTPVKAENKPGRNENCPCGSGKKYKNCCLK